MKQKWIKRIGCILLTPILIFATLMVLLYVPPIQNLLRRQATAYASKATGMQIEVRRIDLRFPLNLLVRGVQVVQPPDTLLTLESLNIHIQALPLLRGQLEIDDITLQHGSFYSGNLIEGMQVEGVLGQFTLNSHGIDLSNQAALINNAALSNTHIKLLLNDTTTIAKDSTETPIRWQVNLQAMRLHNVSFQMQLPADSMQVSAHIGEAVVSDASVNLAQQAYSIQQLLLTGTSVRYDTGSAHPAPGFDPAHIALQEIRIVLDSVKYEGRTMNAVLREASMNDRSGLSITSLTGKLCANPAEIQAQRLQLRTPHSEIDFDMQAGWDLINNPTTGHLAAHLDARMGKQDVMLLAGNLPQTFRESYPFRPLAIQVAVGGNLQAMQITKLSANLPGSFSLKGDGELANLTDSIHREGRLTMKMNTRNLNYLVALAGFKPGNNVVVPDSILLTAKASMHGSQYKAALLVHEGQGTVQVDGSFNTATEVYQADLKIDALQLHHFLPHDSIYELTASASAGGRGIAVASRRSSASFNAQIQTLGYANYQLSTIEMTGEVKQSIATAHLSSDNSLLKMTVDARYNLAQNYPEGSIDADVTQVGLYELGLIPQPWKHPLAFKLKAEAQKERLTANLTAGDMQLSFTARTGVTTLIKQSTHFIDVLQKQVEHRELDHAQLRQALPTAVISFSTKRENPLAYYLAGRNITYNDVSVRFGAAPNWGINGRATIRALKVDTLQLDTIFLSIRQDTTLMNIRGDVTNGAKNPQITFKAALTGEIRDKDAEMTLQYWNSKGETGVLFGVNARLRSNGDGLVFKLIPQQPIIAYRKFHFVEDHNWIYLHKNRRVYANVDMLADEGMGFRLHSVQGDTVSLQNMDVEVRRIRLEELSSVLPYLPRLTGLFSAEANYIQTPATLQLSAEAVIEELTYEKQRVGNLTLGATWLPGERGKQYISTYLKHDDVEILVADGALYPQTVGKDSIAVHTTLEHFPLSIANVLLPNQLVALSGDMDGELHITGDTDNPLVNGKITLDSVSVYARQAGAQFRFDNRPVHVKESRMVFDKFAIFTTSKNPFTIDGYVDFRDINRPLANLTMLASNYTLLNAPRTSQSLVYGKLFVDCQSTLRGRLNALVMRGNINLLGSTDLTYVLTDSPLTVQDRLGDLVTFTSFSDTTAVDKDETAIASLGGLDMVMMVNIAPAVRLKADLSADRSNRVELEGGGSLSLKYTPQGDLSLSGRYTLSGGLLKYSLPIVPLKDFVINSGSYVEWSGNPMDPTLKFRATERLRASVGGGESGQSRMVNFDISLAVKNKLENLALEFEIEAPEDAAVQNELATMGAEERSKQAIALMATGRYLANVGATNALSMGAALNNVLVGQINSLAGGMKNTSISVGVEDHSDFDAGGKRTDYSFRYSQRLFNDRVQVVLGGKVSTGGNAGNNVESFIDNISLEYRLDASGSRYVRLFHDKNYESVFEGEITETGVGLILRKKLDRLSELFIFKKKK